MKKIALAAIFAAGLSAQQASAIIVQFAANPQAADTLAIIVQDVPEQPVRGSEDLLAIIVQ
ncbi:MAG: hypothetical protein REI94_19160 [Moraxellaceae bacterium]|nr:hypothetical protein [Moraxellaceae bacterium]